MDNIVISRNDFKALASRTRTEIIKILRERQHTLTELSKKLELSGPTVKQHLGILQKATIIQQMDEGRKWKYYSLTRKGKSMLLEQPTTPFVIMLAITTIALIGMLYAVLAPTQALAIQESTEKAAAVPSIEADYGEASRALQEKTMPSANPLIIAVIIIALIEGYLIAKTVR